MVLVCVIRTLLAVQRKRKAAMNNSATMLQDRAYEYLKQKIRDGVLDENKIYSLNAISKMLDMSKTPVRDALQLLSREDLIEILPSRGFRLKRFSEKDVIELFELRCAIEGYCCYTIASKPAGDKGYEDIINRLKENIELQRKAVADRLPEGEYFYLDTAFHDIIYSCVDNSRFKTTLDMNRDRNLCFTRNSLETGGIIDLTFTEHKNVLDAIIKHDPLKAYNTMIEHLKTPLRRNLEKLRKANTENASDLYLRNWT